MDKLWWDQLKARIGLGIRMSQREPITIEAPRQPLALPAPRPGKDTLIEEIVHLRNHGLTQAEIGRRVGLAQPQVSVILRRLATESVERPTQEPKTIQREPAPKKLHSHFWGDDPELVSLSNEEQERVGAFFAGQRVRRSMERGVFGDGNLGLPTNATGVITKAGDDTHTMTVLVDGRSKPESYFRGYWELPERPMSKRYWQIRQERIAA